MRPRVKASLLWGVVGALAFLVLVQGYVLAVAPLSVSPLAVGAVALLVGAIATGATYALGRRLDEKEQT